MRAPFAFDDAYFQAFILDWLCRLIKRGDAKGAGIMARQMVRLYQVHQPAHAELDLESNTWRW